MWSAHSSTSALALNYIYWHTICDSLFLFVTFFASRVPLVITFTVHTHSHVPPFIYCTQESYLFVLIWDNWLPCILIFCLSLKSTGIPLPFARSFQETNITICQPYRAYCHKHIWLQDYLTKVKNMCIFVQCICFLPAWFCPCFYSPC
jgi:hypothetical protein